MTKSNIDEKTLQDSIARGIPKPMEYTPTSLDNMDIGNDNTPRITNKQKGEIYINSFLKRGELTDRRSVYVSKDTHKRLSNFINIVGGDGVSLSSYVEAILRQHMEEYKDIINGLSKSYFEPPIQ